MAAAKLTRPSGKVEYYSGSTRVSKDVYEREAAKEAEVRKKRAATSRRTPVKSEAQKIVETTELSKFGTAEAPRTAKLTRPSGDVEYIAAGRTVYKATRPSERYGIVTKSTGQQVYQFAASTRQGVQVREVDITPVAVKSESGKITGYTTGRRFSIQRPQQVQQVSAGVPERLGVYDIARQQTRPATPTESFVLGQQLRGTEMSYLTPPKQRGVAEILRDPSTQKVFFTPTKEGVVPVAVYSTPTYERPKPVYGASRGKVKTSEVGALSREFKAGFGLRPSPSFDMTGSEKLETALTGRLATTGETLGMFQAGTRRLAHTAGVSLGIATLSKSFWKGFGVKAGAVAYQSPKIWKGVTVAGKALSSPAGKYFQKSALVLYGGFKAVDVGVAARTEGAVGVAREGFKITRVAAGVTGFGKGFKEGAAKGIRETYYLATGKARAATVIKDAGRFKTGIATRGKLYEFTGAGKLRRTFTFKDVSRVTGTTKEIVRVTTPRTSLGRKVATTDVVRAYLKGRTTVALGAKPYTRYGTVSDIKALQKSQITMLGKRGIGESRFQFAEAKNIFRDELQLRVLGQQKVYGVGKSRFKIVKYDDLIKVRGKVATVDSRVTSRFDFREQIQIGRPTRQFVDLTGDSGLISKQAAKQLSQGLVGKVTPTVSKEAVKVAFAIPKQKARVVSVERKPVSVPKTVRESFYSGKLFIPTDLEQEFKQQYGIGVAKKVGAVTDVGVESFTGMVTAAPPISRERERTRQRSRVGVVPSPAVDFDTMISQRVQPKGRVEALLPKMRLAQKQEVALRQVQVFDAPVGFGKGFGLGFGRPVSPLQPIAPPSYLPDFSGESKKPKGMRERPISFETKYSPTIEAELFNIRGAKPSKFRIQSGLSVRPLL